MKVQENQTPYMELTDIDKTFGITRALQGVTLKLYAGEVIGLVGPNGAGKSTLMKIITGVLSPTKGSIKVEGKEMSEKYGAKEAKEAGIACAYQDLSLCTNLNVYENFALLNVDHKIISKMGWRKEAQKNAQELLEKYFPNNGINVLSSIEKLTLADRQIVEICKTLMTDNLEVLILDEPTSALSTDKARQLHEVVHKLSAQGVAVIYISHKLDEIQLVSDRIVMMRNGQITGEFDAREIDTDELVEKMGGEKKNREQRTESAENVLKEKMVEVNRLNSGMLKDIHMYVNKGEIVGISGLVGSGQTDLLNAIFRAHKKPGVKTKEGVLVNGSIAYVSGDRSKEGVFQLWDIEDNILIANLDQVKEKGLLSRKKSDSLAQHWYDKLKFRAEGIHSPIMSLSGGNQQKALIARGIASGADLIILNDPTAGVDIETKQEIYGLLDEAKKEGKSIILYSTEDSEIEICDRAYIMHEGVIAEELKGNDITVSNIVTASFKDVGKAKTTAETERKENVAARILKAPTTLPILTLIVMIFANASMNRNLLSYMGFEMLVGSAVPLVFVALSQMFIVVAGDIDMGNGTAIGLVNVLFGVVYTGNPLVGIIGMIIFVAAYIGMGALIHIRRIPAIVVTLGTQYIWLGVALVLCPTPGGYCPEWFMAFYDFAFPLLPMPVVISLAAGVICWYILKRSKYGMVLRGIGNNPVSVERSGWSYMTARLTNYGIAAVLLILSGMSFTAVCRSADANGATTYQMLSIATIILGGCEMSGGKVVPMGVAAGAVAMTFITTLLTSLRINSNFQTAVTGGILIAVLAIKLISHRKEAAK